MNTETKTKPAVAAAASIAEPKPSTKIATVIALLTREEGATLEELTKATGWQTHSVRAALTGLKKKGHRIARSERDDISCYRIEGQV